MPSLRAILKLSWVRWCGVSVAMVLLMPCMALAQIETQTVEYQVKAAFLYKFAAYIEWPAQTFDRADSPFVIAVFNADSFADTLEQTTSGRRVNGHPFEIRRLHKGASAAGAQILFVPRAATPSDALTLAKGQAILIVTEVEPGASNSGMINFVLADDKVRFDITPSVAEQSNLKISARLLGVARKVIGRTS